jgi:hypothetical protein
VKIRDRISGITAPLGDGRYFAIIMPLCQVKCHHGLPTGFQLQTIDRSGRVLITDEFDRGM